MKNVNQIILALISLVPVQVCISASTYCGDYNRPPCNNNSSQYCNAGLSLIGNICTLDSTSWPAPKELDNSRGLCATPSGTMINCWRHDDEYRDKLMMNSEHLNFTTVLTLNKTLEDGRYIFVVRNDKNMVVRKFDRDESFTTTSDIIVNFDYSAYRYSGNWRYVMRGTGQNTSEACTPGSDTSTKICTYQHVRHSQINGTSLPNSAWAPVYCAGELRVFKGKIDRINNESGHFKPTAQCVTEIVIPILRALQIPQSDFLLAGDFRDFSAREIYSCGGYSGPYPPSNDMNDNRRPMCGMSTDDSTVWEILAGNPCKLTAYTFDFVIGWEWRWGHCADAAKRIENSAVHVQ